MQLLSHQHIPGHDLQATQPNSIRPKPCVVQQIVSSCSLGSPRLLALHPVCTCTLYEYVWTEFRYPWGIDIVDLLNWGMEGWSPRYNRGTWLVANVGGLDQGWVWRLDAYEYAYTSPPWKVGILGLAYFMRFTPSGISTLGKLSEICSKTWSVYLCWSSRIFKQHLHNLYIVTIDR
jgi:hypothetical protein